MPALKPTTAHRIAVLSTITTSFTNACTPARSIPGSTLTKGRISPLCPTRALALRISLVTQLEMPHLGHETLSISTTFGRAEPLQLESVRSQLNITTERGPRVLDVYAVEHLTDKITVSNFSKKSLNKYSRSVAVLYLYRRTSPSAWNSRTFLLALTTSTSSTSLSRHRW